MGIIEAWKQEESKLQGQFVIAVQGAIAALNSGAKSVATPGYARISIGSTREPRPKLAGRQRNAR